MDSSETPVAPKSADTLQHRHTPGRYRDSRTGMEYEFSDADLASMTDGETISRSNSGISSVKTTIASFNRYFAKVVGGS